jgi:hypothetical protein
MQGGDAPHGTGPHRQATDGDEPVTPLDDHDTTPLTSGRIA